MDTNKLASNAIKIKINNRKLVLEVLQLYSPISRSEIAEITGLTRAAVTNIIKEFSKVGLIEEIGKKDTPLGRKKQLIRIKKEAFYVIGLEISRDRLRVGVFNAGLEIKELLEEKLDIKSKGAKVIENALQLTKKVIKESMVPRDKIFGLGVGIPGCVDHKKGVVGRSPIFEDGDEINLSEYLGKKLGIHVWVENDANASALGEKWSGIGRKHRNFVYVLSDIGLSCGIILNGNLFKGAIGCEGEIGNIIVKNKNKFIPLENLVSILRLQTSYNKLTKKKKSAEEILKLVKNGDKTAYKVFKEIVDHIAIGVVSIVNILSPEAIVLGGRITIPGKKLITNLKKRIDKFCVAPTKPEVYISEINEMAEVTGGAALVLESIVSNPTIIL